MSPAKAQYLGNSVTVIEIDNNSALISYGGDDRTFVKASDLDNLEQPPVETTTTTKKKPEVKS